MTGVINWDLSSTVPLQAASLFPPFITHLPIDIDPKAEDWLRVSSHYIHALNTYERHFRQLKSSTQTKWAPTISPLLQPPDILRRFAWVAEVSDRDVSVELWEKVFEPMFGRFEKSVFIDIYRKAPGVIEEFERTRAFLQSRKVGSFRSIELVIDM